MDVITTHVTADFDALASMIAAKKLYPDAVLVLSGGQERSLRNFFIQSALYSLNLEAISKIDVNKITRLILVDTRQRARIGKFAEIIGKPGVEIHIFDHHPPSDDDIKGDYEIVKEVGSTSTILAELLQEKRIPLESSEATILTLGIYEDTGSLTFSTTTPRDYMAAAFLLQSGANLNTVADLMSRTMTTEQILLLHDLLRNAKKMVFPNATIVITEAYAEEFQDDLAICIHRMRDMESLDVIFALIQTPDRIFLIARSRIDSVNAGEIASYFGGGGHATAASATIRDLTLIQARERLQALLMGIFSSPARSLRAWDIMSRPPITIRYNELVETAKDVLARYHINVLAVMDDNGNLAGLISRQAIERAIYHGLSNRPVSDFYLTGFATIHPDADFKEVYALAVGGKQRLLPVMKDGKLIGVITRTDILANITDPSLPKPESLIEVDKQKNKSWHKNLSSIIEERFPKPILNALHNLGEMAFEMGFSSFLVGGTVRDLILKRPNIDIDIVVEGDAIKLAHKFGETHQCKVYSHSHFSTAAIFLSPDLKIDLATARMEFYAEPAALPVVESSSVKLDMYRRDFTINTLLCYLSPERFGELLDFFGAYQDLKDGQIRILHTLSFVEDPTRILRALRFEQRFGFAISKSTMRMLRSAIQQGYLARLDGHRLFSEIKLILQEDDPRQIIARMNELKILSHIHPQLYLDDREQKLLDELFRILSWYKLLYFEDDFEPSWLWLQALLSRLNQKYLSEALDRLAVPSKIKNKLMKERHATEEILYALMQKPKIMPSKIHLLLSNHSVDMILFLMAKVKRESIKKSISVYLTHLRQIHLEISGKDLAKLGVQPGPIYSAILRKVLESKLDGKVRSYEEELACAKEVLKAEQEKAASIQSDSPDHEEL